MSCVFLFNKVIQKNIFNRVVEKNSKENYKRLLLQRKFRLNKKKNFINMSTSIKDYVTSDSLLMPFNGNAKLLKSEVCITIVIHFYTN